MIPIREKITEICKRLHGRNLLAAADGNVSVRISDDEILITPSGINKAFMNPSQIAVITLDDEILEGSPSSERLMHLEIYRNCSKAKAVVHAHPPHGIAWSVAHPEMEELPYKSLSEVILAVGRVPIVPYARPSTLQMGTNLKPFLPKRRVMILARHGAISWGEDLDEAYNGMERLEHTALILSLASQMGPITSLPDVEVEALIKMREKLGDRSL